MELYFQGMARWNKRWTSGHMAQARSFFERALALDPENIEALVGVAAVDAASATMFLIDDPHVRLAAAATALNKALSLAPQHALAHMFLGIVKLGLNRAAEGVAEIEYALALNRNLADAHANLGVAKIHVGRAVETEIHVHEAMRLSPRDEGVSRWFNYVGAAKLVLGADADAVVWLHRCLKANSNYPIAHFELAAGLALLGRLEEAGAAAKAGLALDPTFTIQRLKRFQIDDPIFRAGARRIVKGMHIAGIPGD
jgi:tetratricopeptide (TPR) repeat protein